MSFIDPFFITLGGLALTLSGPHTGDHDEEPALRILCPAVPDVILPGQSTPLGLHVGQILPPELRALSRTSRKLRILAGPGIGTMDLVPDRLNIRIDADAHIVRLSCG